MRATFDYILIQIHTFECKSDYEHKKFFGEKNTKHETIKNSVQDKKNK